MHTHASTASTPVPAGLLSAAGAVLAALLASACCWLPLLLVGAGASVMGAAAFFETYRPLFLGATGLLLAGGFYLTYVRAPACAPGEVCASPNPRLRRLQRVSLWVATVLVVLFATFPSYVGALLGAGDEPPEPAASVTPAAAPARAETRVYTVTGMSCESCAARLQKKLAQIPGVRAATIAFDAGTATVVFEPGRADDDTVLRTIADAGFQGRRAADRT